MTRLSDWQSRLHFYLQSVERQPFAYGVLDCGLFCAGAVEAMTGIDPAAVLRGRYTTRREAFGILKSLCGGITVETVAIYLAARVGTPEIPLLRAQRGDPVLLGSGRHSSLGILAMHGFEVLQISSSGILRMPLSLATRAWHV